MTVLAQDSVRRSAHAVTHHWTTCKPPLHFMAEVSLWRLKDADGDALWRSASASNEWTTIMSDNVLN